MGESDGAPVRVAQIMGKFVPGGIKSVLLNRYKSINHSLVQFDFVVDEGSASPEDYEEVKALGARVFEIPPVSQLSAYISALRRLLVANDFPIAHAYVNTLNVFPMYAAYKANVPVRIAENLSTAHKGEPKTLAKKVLRPFNRRYPTNLAANSELSARWMYGKHASECAIIRNALDLNAFAFDEMTRNEVRAKMGWEDKFVIGHVGRFQYQKNHDFLVSVFSEVACQEPDSLLALIGYGPLEERVSEKVERCGLKNRVVFLGGREDLAGFYNAFDCFVLPSFYEGLPVVAIEAQAAGLPCVLSGEITTEAGVLEDTSFLPLEAGAVAWAEEVLSKKGLPRRDTRERMRLAGYDIEAEARWLEEYYLSLAIRE